MRISVEEIEQVFHRLIERIKQDEIKFKETLLNVVTALAVKITTRRAVNRSLRNSN